MASVSLNSSLLPVPHNAELQMQVRTHAFGAVLHCLAGDAELRESAQEVWGDGKPFVMSRMEILRQGWSGEPGMIVCTLVKLPKCRLLRQIRTA